MHLACSGISRWFEKRATIVTPNPFLASVAARQFADEQLGAGMSGWARPGIYSIEAWLVTCWQQVRYAAPDVATLLSPAQERALWRQIIERENQVLFDTNTAARLASDAQRLMAEWKISNEGEIWTQHQDARQFQSWRAAFRKRCAEEGWMVRADLWSRVPLWLADGILSPALTVFAGFEDVHPALRSVIDGLGENGIAAPVTGHAAKGVPAEAFDEFSEEIEHAARWARAMYQEGKFRSIGVGIPDLRSHRVQVERVFSHVFYPSRLRVSRSSSRDSGTQEDSIFHVAAARPLANEPLVANAILLLELARPRIHHADAGAILRSPYLDGAIEERDLRAQADFALRRKRELDFSLRDIEYASRDCPKLTRLWLKAREVLRVTRIRQELGEWTRFVSEFLGALGWPGERELNAVEQKVVEDWEASLSRLAALSLIVDSVSWDEARTQLARILAGSGIEVGELSSPVQVLDTGDMGGLEFDCVLIAGMSDEGWPTPVKISPLVPLALQRAQKVPGSTPATAKRQREEATGRLVAAAPIVAVTYSGRISPLVEPFVNRVEKRGLPRWNGVLPRQSFVTSQLEELEDTYAPRFVQSETTRGGTSIIKSQSQCPFRALAEFRLHARAPDDASFGLDSRERGGFLHKALENVWAELKTQERLLKLPDQELRSLVQAAICEAVKTSENGPLHVLVSNTERARLEEVILGWLTRVERVRRIPFAVENMEQERYIEFPGLRLRLRVDRVDRLRDGSILLFDYKSGAQSKKKLDGPRPQEPQLLLYASALETPVDGIFFGEMRARNTRAVGYSRSKYFAGASSTALRDWDDFLARSEAEVEHLAKQFVTGYAAVDPLKNACGFCGLGALCRVNERVKEVEDDEA